MKAVILAGGYAKRLWPLTKETPKPLLDVGGKEIITRLIEKIEKIDEIKEIVISTNAKFRAKFKEYVKKLKTSKKVRLVVEPTMKEGEKLGSIGGLNFLMDHLKIEKDTLIIGGDNIFEFNMRKFFDFYKEKDASIIALKEMEKCELMKKYGICTLDENDKICGFEEKPEKPKSCFVSTACYLFKHDDLMLVKKYLKEGNSPDAMGFFITWVIKKTDIYGYVFGHPWYDIGSIEQLEEARRVYSKKA
jgi:glucose-1-phosphate thymidylyltransferase